MLTTNPFDDDKLREECGVFGVSNSEGAAAMVALGLHALQHRGQEAAGIVSFDGRVFHSERRMGLVGDSFSDLATIERLKGQTAIGHVRYSTTGSSGWENTQPIYRADNHMIALAHNGNLINSRWSWTWSHPPSASPVRCRYGCEQDMRQNFEFLARVALLTFIWFIWWWAANAISISPKA